MTDDLLHARVAVLESQVPDIKDDIKEILKQQAQIIALLNQAKGAKWALFSMAAFGGGVAGFASKFLPFLGK